MPHKAMRCALAACLINQYLLIIPYIRLIRGHSLPEGAGVPVGGPWETVMSISIEDTKQYSLIDEATDVVND